MWVWYTQTEINQAFIAHVEANLERPPSLFDALGYDVTQIVASAFDAAPTDRTSLRDALLATVFEQAVAGGGAFNEAREVQRKFVVFTVLKEGIAPVPPAPLPGDEPVQPPEKNTAAETTE